MISDFDRLSIETNSALNSGVGKAMKEWQGEETFEKAFESETFRYLLRLSLLSDRRLMKHERMKLYYEKYSLGELLQSLYERMLMFYDYAACKGRELPGFDWSLEPDGVFAITLGQCTVNMEHSVNFGDKHGTAFTVWQKAPVLATEDPRSNDCPNKGKFGLYVGFGCEWIDDNGNKEYQDLELSDIDVNEIDSYKELLRDTLASFDVIGDKIMQSSKYSFNDLLRDIMQPSPLDSVASL